MSGAGKGGQDVGWALHPIEKLVHGKGQVVQEGPQKRAMVSVRDSRASLPQFVRKSAEFLRNGVHLLVIDLLPPSPRDPYGIHKAIFDEFEDRPFEFPSDKQLILAAYAAGEPASGLPTTAYVEPVEVGDILPDMPAYHDWAAWSTCPADMRELVESGRLTSEQVELWLGVWAGAYLGVWDYWLRFFADAGELVPTASEFQAAWANSEAARANSEAAEKEAERTRAERAEVEIARLQQELADARRSKP